MNDKGQMKETRTPTTPQHGAGSDHFVLEKSIFSNIFEKDIKRVYIYKKAERLAKAIHLIAPAFRQTPSLHDRVGGIAVALIDAAIMTPMYAREALSRELLALSSMLSIARTSGTLSPMNADLVSREAHLLLEEIAGYEEPRLSMPDSPTLAELAKEAVPLRRDHTPVRTPQHVSAPSRELAQERTGDKGQSKGHIKDRDTPTFKKTDRREAILSVLRSKGPSYIKDISTVIRDVSEKTIQRELHTLVEDGVISRAGERRWTTYALAG